MPPTRTPSDRATAVQEPGGQLTATPILAFRRLRSLDLVILAGTSPEAHLLADLVEGCSRLNEQPCTGMRRANCNNCALGTKFEALGFDRQELRFPALLPPVCVIQHLGKRCLAFLPKAAADLF